MIEKSVFTFLFFLNYLLLVSAKKMQTSRMSYRTCCMRQFVQVRNSLILLCKFNIKTFLKKGKLHGHLFSNYKEKI